MYLIVINKINLMSIDNVSKVAENLFLFQALSFYGSYLAIMEIVMTTFARYFQ